MRVGDGRFDKQGLGDEYSAHMKLAGLRIAHSLLFVSRTHADSKVISVGEWLGEG